MATPGFAFANPKPSPDDYNEFDPQDVAADSSVAELPDTEVIPAPWKTPPVMSLSEVIGANASQQIQTAGKIVFHSVGDTGGVKEPSHQFAVADAMSADIGTETFANGRPAFFYHLGDVVYYFGQERYYYDQFLRSLPGLRRAHLRHTWKSRWRTVQERAGGILPCPFLRKLLLEGSHKRSFGKGFCAHHDDAAWRLFHFERAVFEDHRALFEYGREHRNHQQRDDRNSATAISAKPAGGSGGSARAKGGGSLCASADGTSSSFHNQ
jgi:hypothetical protein